MTKWWLIIMALSGPDGASEVTILNDPFYNKEECIAAAKLLTNPSHSRSYVGVYAYCIQNSGGNL